MRAFRNRGLTAAEQYHLLRSNPLSAGEGSVRAGRLVWRFAVRPTPLSRKYNLRIEFQQGRAPQTFCESPDLTELAGDRDLPHVYSTRPVQLCLYHPGYREWDSTMRVDQTIVPWATLWLVYFEDWLASDNWKGGGEHPRRRGKN
jgi:hypothetical protein